MPIDVNCSAWKGFRTGEWRHLVNVRNFIQKNYTPYAGDESFLAPTSERTQKVWDKSHALILEELRKGILDVETDAISGINNFAPGYIDRDNEVIVGLQTDAPLKRIVNLYGGKMCIRDRPCIAPAAPDSACISTSFTGWPNRFFLPLVAHASTWSAMGLEGVMG